MDAFFAQHGNIKAGVVGNDDVSWFVDQCAELIVAGAVFKPRFVFDHLIGDVMYGHGLNGNRLAGVEQLIDDGPLPVLKAN
jgi:hypothetical protein